MSRDRSNAFGNLPNAPYNIRRNNINDTINGIVLRLNRVFFKDDADMKRRFLEHGVLKRVDGKLVLMDGITQEQIEAAFGKSYDEIHRLLKENQTRWNTMYPLPERYLRVAADYIIYGKDFLNWNDMVDKQIWSPENSESSAHAHMHITWNCKETPEDLNILHFAIGNGEYTFLPSGMSTALKINDTLWTYPIIRKFIREGRFMDASPVVKESLLRTDPELARIAQVRSEARNRTPFKENQPTRRFRVPMGGPMRITRRRRGRR